MAASAAGGGMTDMERMAQQRHLHRILNMKCRYFPHDLPHEEDLIMVQVRRVTEMGAYVECLEFENLTGLILLSELSRRRIRSIKKLVSEGKREVVSVLTVNEAAPSVDLSKRNVAKDDRVRYEETFLRAKAFISMMREVVRATSDEWEEAHPESDFNALEDLMRRFGWPLWSEFKDYGEATIAVGKDKSILDRFALTDLEKELIAAEAARRLETHEARIRADIEATCFHYAGIDAVRDAIAEGIRGAPADLNLQVKLVAPPHYTLIGTCTDRVAGLDSMKTVIEAMSAHLVAQGGNIAVVEEPYVVNAEEEEGDDDDDE